MCARKGGGAGPRFGHCALRPPETAAVPHPNFRPKPRASARAQAAKRMQGCCEWGSRLQKPEKLDARQGALAGGGEDSEEGL